MENDSPKCELDVGKRSSSSSGQPTKRLKQACLQFKNVGTKSIDNCTHQKTSRKRPLSSSEDDVNNTSKSETEDASQSARNNKTLGICKENQGPPRSKNKLDTLKKNKSSKKQNMELKPANSVWAKNSDDSVLVDLSIDSGDELIETDIQHTKTQDLVSNVPISAVEHAKINKITASQLSTTEVENVKLNKGTTNDNIEKPSDQDSEVVYLTPTKNTNSEMNEHVNNCINAVILNSSNTDNKTIADVAEKLTEPDNSPKSEAEKLLSQSDHIDDCIEYVIKSSVNVEVASVSNNGDIQQKVPTQKKKLTKVRRSASEELAMEREKQEKLKVQLETAKLRAELKRQRDEAKQQREKEKAEALAKRKKDEAEKLERLQIKEEERKKREEALQAKSEEKLKKAKEKQERDDEKRKVEEEERRKKNKVKAAFVSFFVKKDISQLTGTLEPENVSSFRPSDNVQRAPLHRNCSSNSSDLIKTLDSALKAQSCSLLYLEQLKKKQITPGKSYKLPPPVDRDVEIIECNGQVEQHQKAVFKAKLLQFSEDIRPPYWGTWRKRSKFISSRTPFGRDNKYFDYEVDSEAEWEEEEPGESLSNSEGEKESEDDYEVDNEFFVPHGYLSEEEVQDSAEMSPADFKEQLKLKQKEFEIERKKKCQQLKPCVLGCFWMADDHSGNEEVTSVLEAYSAVLLTPGSIETRYSIWLTTSSDMPQKTPSPSSSNADRSLPLTQTKSEKSALKRLNFPPKFGKPLVGKKIGDTPLVDLT